MFMLLIFKHVTCTRYPHLGLTLVFSRITIHCLFFQFQVTPVSSLFWKKTIMCISLTFHNLCIICSTNISGIFTHEMNLLEMCQLLSLYLSSILPDFQVQVPSYTLICQMLHQQGHVEFYCIISFRYSCLLIHCTFVKTKFLVSVSTCS